MVIVPSYLTDGVESIGDSLEKWLEMDREARLAAVSKIAEVDREVKSAISNAGSWPLSVDRLSVDRLSVDGDMGATWWDRAGAAVREFIAWSAWQIDKNARGDISGENLIPEVKLRVDQVSGIALGTAPPSRPVPAG